jgi:hypothetical protein
MFRFVSMFHFARGPTIDESFGTTALKLFFATKVWMDIFQNTKKNFNYDSVKRKDRKKEHATFLVRHRGS